VNSFKTNKTQSDELVEIEIAKLNKFGLGSLKKVTPNYGLCFIDVPYTLPGEISLININNYKKTLIEGSLVKLKTYSTDRIKPICKHFAKCGGCLIQHLDFKKYLDWKFNLIFNPISKISPQTKFDKIFCTENFTRRRAKVFVKKEKNKFFIGFKHFRSNKIADISQCIILDSKILKVINSINELLEKILDNGDELVLHLNKLDAGIDILIETKIKFNFQQLSFLTKWSLSNNVVRISLKKNSNQFELIGLFDKLSLNLLNSNLYMLPPPGGFFQATKFAEEILVNSILKYLSIQKKYKIIELFSGAGTITLPLLKNKHKLYAFDLNENSINSLVKAAKEQNLYNNLQTSIENLIKNPIEPNFLNSFDAVIIDPPRSGARNQFLKLAKSKVKLIISISCDTQSFVSDTRVLLENGYKLKFLIPIDQFLYTHHLEIIGFFEKA